MFHHGYGGFVGTYWSICSPHPCGALPLPIQMVPERTPALRYGDPGENIRALTPGPVTMLATASVMDYARACAAHGRHDQALPLLRSLTERDPFNERAARA
jgi:hypothetical protein